MYPINYTVFEDAILFRTRRGGEIDSVSEGELMAFEIDGTDSLYHEGWSVLVVGPCSRLNGSMQIEQCRDINLLPWADQKRDRYVRIPLQMVSGRRISHEMTLLARGGTETAPMVAGTTEVRLAHERGRELQAAHERNRIARDLHDVVMQRAFGVAMHLSSVLSDVPADAADRLKEMITELDQVISAIRTTVFDLQSTNFAHPQSRHVGNRPAISARNPRSADDVRTKRSEACAN